MKKCPKCGRIYNGLNDFYCLNDHYRLENYSKEECEKDQIRHRPDKYCVKCNKIYKNTLSCTCGLCGRQLVPFTDNMPKCPTCGSMQVAHISGAKRAAHGIAFGFLSKTAFSQFECKNCGYKW